MAKKPVIQVKKGKVQHRVVLKAKNNKTVMVSETYSSKAGANKAAVRLKKIVAKATVKKKK